MTTERRSDARILPDGITRATLRPGCLVLLVDVSAGGALVQSSKPLRPGTRAHLQIVTAAHSFAISAHVLRCAVWSLDAMEGVLYRGAMKFDQRWEALWAATTPPGSLVPRPGLDSASAVGTRYPRDEGDPDRNITRRTK